MKTIRKQILMALLGVLLMNCNTIYSQSKVKEKKLFVRVYDLNGDKVNKGHVLYVNDTLLVLKKGDKLKEVKVNLIGKIKTKRSAGNNVLVGSAIGMSTGTILGFASGESDPGFLEYTKGEGAAAGAISGGIIGALIGSVTIAFKNSETYIINSKINNWKIFKEAHQ